MLHLDSMSSVVTYILILVYNPVCKQNSQYDYKQNIYDTTIPELQY